MAAFHTLAPLYYRVVTLTVNNIREADGVTGPHILTYFRLCENITITVIYDKQKYL
ncbi:hypothetical protein RhiirA4_492368 [Rhizophagus irregularis]|uniref:Uncharacterized protein n=1 Tax=Rhizophagus irregularis TaxID=588596 RepID=A0A2I1HX58_9GLOM|nr:hypothetical protein RhiirA4_492368 [Rhizophagus irregularis]